MLEIFNKWYERYLFEEESVLLLVLIFLSLWLFTRLTLARWVGAGLPVAIPGAAILIVRDVQVAH